MIEVNHEYYVSPEVAKLLEEAGFDWECKKIHFKTGRKGNDDVWELEDNNKKTKRVLELDYCLLAPTLDVAQRWLRKVKKYHIYVSPYSLDDETYVTNIVISDSMWGPLWDDNKKTIIFKTHEEALEAGIKKCLTLTKSWKNRIKYPSADEVSVIPIDKMKPTQRILFIDR